MVTMFTTASMRQLKLKYILIENIRALLVARRIDQGDMAFAVGHSNAWISKILSGDRNMSIEDIDKVAGYFGLTGSQLVCHGISSVTERRKRERRSGEDRRKGDRRRENVADLVVAPFWNRENPSAGDDEEGAA